MRRFKSVILRGSWLAVPSAMLLALAVAYGAHAAGDTSPWWSIDAGGGARTSASFRLSDTVGQGGTAGTSRSGQFSLVSGFQAGSQSGAVQPPGPGTFNLTISIRGSGTTLPAAGVYNYPAGTPVNVTATPAAAWAFGYWSGDASGSATQTNVVMNYHKSVTANFAPQGFTLIGAIKQNPAAYENRTVKISGQYRGWEAGHGSAPVTRSDWVLQDGTGSIYVTGSSMGLRHGRDLGKPVMVNGIVRLKNGVPYVAVLGAR